MFKIISMLKVRSLLMNKCSVRLPGLSIHQIRINRHEEETEWIEAHSHPFEQLLLYLTGGGIQKVSSREYQVGVGSVFFVPRGTKHSFHRQSGRRPLSLIIDFRYNAAKKVMSCRLNQGQINQVRHQLSLLSNNLDSAAASLNLDAYGNLLVLMDVLLKASFGMPAKNLQNLSPVIRKVDSMILNREYCEEPLSKIANRVGLQRDYLNRLLKRQIGLTLGQYRSQKLLEKAQKLLEKPHSKVQDVSFETGFVDPNYFARWFKQQAGVSPREWKSAPS